MSIDIAEEYMSRGIATSRFRMGQAALLRRMAAKSSPLPWGVLAILFIAFLMLEIFVNLRFIIVAMMLIFIAAPLIAAYLYFSFGFSQYVAFNSLPHTLSFRPEGVDVNIFTPAPEREEKASESEDEDKDDAAEEEETPQEIVKTIFIPREMMQKAEIHIDAIIIPLKAEREGFIYVPRSAVDEAE